MAYSTTYTDERGSSVPVSISDEESREAIRNDWNVLRGMFNPRYVTVEEVACESGEEFRFRITVHAPSHYLTDRDDASPKSCSSMSAEVAVFLGYPLTDVVGFIENSGRNFTCCGCWKAYGDPAIAQKHFAQLSKCTAVYLRLFHSGTPILRLAVAA